ncbi:MAG: GrpB family protein, partial [Alphaproteobacteria bacterium]|nr:GrpB family protein [Alphaproteobacteria bacterium]
MGTDTLEPHKDEWSTAYEIESNAIQQNQGTNFVNIFHIGSTAIGKIYAKPKIDIALVVKNLERSKELSQLGYEFKGCLNIPFRYFYTKKTEELCAHLHVLLPGDPELEGFLLFRDYLNAHEDVRKEYSELKLKI